MPARSVTATSNNVVVVDLKQTNEEVEVINHSTVTTIWVRADDVDPSVKGDDCYPVLPLSSGVLSRPNEVAVSFGVNKVSVLSPGADSEVTVIGRAQ